MKSPVPDRNTGKILIYKSSKLLWSVIRAVLIIGLGFLILYPLLIKLSSAFKSTVDLYDTTVFLLPKNFTLSNFTRVMDFIEYPATLMKTALYIALTSFLQMMSCTIVAYGLARFKYKGKSIVFMMAIITLVIPPQTILLPMYIQFKSFSLFNYFTAGMASGGINLINTGVPVILLSLTAVGFKNGLYIFLLRQYFRNLPFSLEEAAYIDGCKVFKTFTKIMLPGAVPMMAAIFLFSFVWQWNDYYYTAILSPDMPLLSARLNNIGYRICVSDNDTWNALLTMLYNNVAILLLLIPLIVLYIFTQKLFVQSVERSGLVG